MDSSTWEKTIPFAWFCSTFEKGFVIRLHWRRGVWWWKWSLHVMNVFSTLTVLQIPLDELATPQNVFWFVVICYISWLSLSLLLLLLLKNPCPLATEPLGLKFKVILRENASIFWPCSSPLLRIRGVCTLPWRVWKQLPVIKIWYHWRKIRS